MTSRQFLHVNLPSFLQVGCSGLQFAQMNVGAAMVVRSLGMKECKCKSVDKRHRLMLDQDKSRRC